MAKATASGTIKMSSLSKEAKPDLSGKLTVVRGVSSDLKVKGMISDKALINKSLTGCSVALEKPGSLMATYDLGSNTTKLDLFTKFNASGKSVKAKVTYDQKGDAWTGEATATLSANTTATIKHSVKDKSTELSLCTDFKGTEFEPSYKLDTKELAVSASRTVKDIPMTASYSFYSKDAELELDLNPVNVKLSSTGFTAPLVCLAVSASKTYEI